MDYNNLTIAEVRTHPMKYLGYANGWSDTPQEVLDATAKGYKTYWEGDNRGDNTYYCPEGGFYYKVDSSG